MKPVFRKFNFRILSMCARVRVIITGKLLCRQFLFRKVNKISEISENIYLRKFPAIRYACWALWWNVGPLWVLVEITVILNYAICVI